MDSGSPFWRIQLDQDLLETISAIYPEWFKVRIYHLFFNDQSNILKINFFDIFLQDDNGRASTSTGTTGARQLNNAEGNCVGFTGAGDVHDHKGHNNNNKTSSKGEPKSSKSKAKKSEAVKDKNKRADYKDQRYISSSRIKIKIVL